MPSKPENKKQIEEILGEKLGDDAVQLIQWIQPVAISSQTPGVTTSQHILVSRPNICSRNNVREVSGFATTGSNGQSLFRLSHFICPNNEVYGFPINVVATPFSSKPCFLTVTHTIVNNGADVEIKVFSWDANGAAAPNISFNWRCRVQMPLQF